MDLDLIFKAYDIRGRTDVGELDEDVARRVGAAFARFTGSATIAVGHDCRLSSPPLRDAFVDGVTSQGTDLLSLGEVATDVVYFVAGSRQVPGAMITASHNPPEYNGIKLCREGAVPVGADTGLAEVRRLAEQELAPASQPGRVESFDPIPGYVDHLFSLVDPAGIRPLRVAADGGNGMAGAVLPQVFGRITAELIPLYLEPDGNFPNHPPDPLRPENLVDLQAVIAEQSADLGVAFDGDADRAFFIDDQRSPLSGSATTALIARWFLEQEPGARIIHNLITSRAVGETVRAHGGEPIRTRVGHSFIKQVMADTGAVFGGEHSGHYYFRDNFRADSGILAMLVLLTVLSEANRPLSELRADVEPYSQSGEINLQVADQEAAMESVVAGFPGAELDRLDGLTVSWPDRWFNLRPSNTEPVLRLNVEATTPGDVAELVDQVEHLVGPG
jgi:phosphomannomutase